MSLLKKLASETAIYGLSSIVSRLLNFAILIPFYTRIFVPDEYGIVSDLYTWTALLVVVFTYRMETTFFRFGSKKGQLDNAFSTAIISLLVSTGLFAALLIGFAQPISDWLQYPDLKIFVIWLILILGLDALAAIPFARLRLENRPIRFASIKIFNILVNIFFIFLFLKWMPESSHSFLPDFLQPSQRIGFVFVANLLASGATLLLLLPLFVKVRLRFDRALWRKMIVYTLPLVMVGFAAVVNSQGGITLLKMLLPGDLQSNLDQTGLYSAALKIAVFMTLFTQAFNYAAEPFFFRHADRSDARRIYGQVAQGFTLVGSLAFLGIMLFIDLIQYFLGPDFRSGLEIAPILLMANLFLGLYYNFSVWYKLTDRTIVGAYISGIGAVITLLINFILIPHIGYFAPAWAMLVCFVFMSGSCYLLGRKHYPIDYPIGKMASYIGISLVTFFISKWLIEMMGIEGMRVLAVNSVLFLVCLFVFFRMEKDLFKQFLPGK